MKGLSQPKYGIGIRSVDPAARSRRTFTEKLYLEIGESSHVKLQSSDQQIRVIKVFLNFTLLNLHNLRIFL